MEFWPEFLAGTWGKEFMAGAIGGMAGVIAGHPLDTVRVRLQQPRHPLAQPVSAVTEVRKIIRTEGPLALFKGMATPVASIAFQVLYASVREFLPLLDVKFPCSLSLWGA